MKEVQSIPMPHPEAVLPTKEMVRKGVGEFDLMMGMLSPEARRFMGRSRDLWRVFVGTTPETGGWSNNLFDDTTPQIQGEVENIFGTSKDFIIVPQVSKDPRRTRHSFINIQAAVRVMREFPNVFPTEAVENPKEWLSGHKKIWKRNIPYGLLSGFPPASVMQFDLDATDGSGVYVPSIGFFVCFETSEESAHIERSQELFKGSGIKSIVEKWAPEVKEEFFDWESL